MIMPKIQQVLVILGFATMKAHAVNPVRKHPVSGVVTADGNVNIVVDHQEDVSIDSKFEAPTGVVRKSQYKKNAEVDAYGNVATQLGYPEREVSVDSKLEAPTGVVSKSGDQERAEGKGTLAKEALTQMDEAVDSYGDTDFFENAFSQGDSDIDDPPASILSYPTCARGPPFDFANKVMVEGYCSSTNCAANTYQCTCRGWNAGTNFPQDYTQLNCDRVTSGGTRVHECRDCDNPGKGCTTSQRLLVRCREIVPSTPSPTSATPSPTSATPLPTSATPSPTLPEPFCPHCYQSNGGRWDLPSSAQCWPSVSDPARCADAGGTGNWCSSTFGSYVPCYVACVRLEYEQRYCGRYRNNTISVATNVSQNECESRIRAHSQCGAYGAYMSFTDAHGGQCYCSTSCVSTVSSSDFNVYWLSRASHCLPTPLPTPPPTPVPTSSTSVPTPVPTAVPTLSPPTSVPTLVPTAATPVPTARTVCDNVIGDVGTTYPCACGVTIAATTSCTGSRPKCTASSDTDGVCQACTFVYDYNWQVGTLLGFERSSREVIPAHGFTSYFVPRFTGLPPADNFCSVTAPCDFAATSYHYLYYLANSRRYNTRTDYSLPSCSAGAGPYTRPHTQNGIVCKVYASHGNAFGTSSYRKVC